MWQKAVDLSVNVYKATENYPKAEIYGLTSQSRRAAVSVAANIAEGYGRQSDGDLGRFLRISQGSLKELETHLHIAKRLAMLKVDNFNELMDDCNEIGRMLRAFINRTANR